MRRIILLMGLSVFLLNNCAQLTMIKSQTKYDYRGMTGVEKAVHKRAERFLWQCLSRRKPVAVIPQTKVEKVVYASNGLQIGIYFNSYFAYNYFRDEDVARIYQAMRRTLGWRFRKANLTLFALDQPIEQLVPNFYRHDRSKIDLSRLPKPTTRPEPVVRNLSRPFTPTKGLAGHNIALWHSHGWYYSHDTQRWEWQRPRLFQTVEDLFPTSFVLPYIIPMLESAGANVFTPRERDTQVNVVVVDNDLPDNADNYYESGSWKTGAGSGFAVGQPPYRTGVNPFQQGTFRYTTTNNQPQEMIDWVPEIPNDGNYAVYIAYSSTENSADDTRYIVYHSGGKTEFAVNQQIGGSTWIYLGTFHFKAGSNPETGKVVLTNLSRTPGKIVTADAVRFGGGMGNIARDGNVSGRPRFTEAARYNLQYSGMPDTLVYTLKKDKDDYYDDYSGRGEWVNYLRGAPDGPNKDRAQKGLGIPVDLSLAFHTDAGITKDESVIGTLSIYSIEDYDSALVFPDGVSRFANRDLADILQTQIVDDIRAKWDPQWNRRQLYNRQYGEAYRPNVPAALIELLSHQNFNDMQFGNDPRFRADVSRAFYKGMLKFLAGQNQTEYVVQPLPVTHFQIEFVDKNSIRLQWQPQSDPLESSAVPTGYIVYCRKNTDGFDNGFLVREPFAIINNLQPGDIYSYKVTAVNNGGESRPSETLSVCCQTDDRPPVLIVNGFDRICGPETIKTESFAGFAGFLDQGVPDGYDL
ncbi:MAG: fibronectin type III domain-containing protein, partial [Candidatus Neomarinimicrobiota bacterium]